jgi:dethiobiotin synthetase
VPERVVLVAGTATEVGKTYVGAALVTELRAAGLSVAARKPVQSFAPGEGPTDADVLATASGERPEDVCPPHRWLPLPMAPPMAADALGRPPVMLDDLLAELCWPTGVDVGLVEAVGGPRSPLADDGDTVDLAARLRPDLIVLVADAGLGTINAVRLSLAALAGHSSLVMLNRYDDRDDLHRRNRVWLADESDVVVDVRSLAAGVQRAGSAALGKPDP